MSIIFLLSRAGKHLLQFCIIYVATLQRSK